MDAQSFAPETIIVLDMDFKKNEQTNENVVQQKDRTVDSCYLADDPTSHPFPRSLA